jgi:hypothetical protein
MESINWTHIAINSVITFALGLLTGLLAYPLGRKLFPQRKPSSRPFISKSPSIKGQESTTESFEGVRTYTRETFYEDVEGNRTITKERFDLEE